LIATYPTHGEAIAVSRGLERDRVVDETGGQTVVFGRRGARPFHLDEMEKFYLHSESGDSKDGRRWGSLYFVEDVTSRSGKLMTKGGVLLTPLPGPEPPATVSPSPPTTHRISSRSPSKVQPATKAARLNDGRDKIHCGAQGFQVKTSWPIKQTTA
jgi:hypothetical protein